MQILGLVLLILFGGVTSIALLASLHLLLPIPLEKARSKLENSLGRAFLLGLVNLVFFGALLLTLLWFGGRIGGLLAGILAFPALLILLALVTFCLNGLAALASLFGERVGAAKSPFWSDTRGGMLLILACLTPYIGWFVFTPFVLCIGLGASVLAMFGRKSTSPAGEKPS